MIRHSAMKATNLHVFCRWIALLQSNPTAETLFFPPSNGRKLSWINLQNDMAMSHNVREKKETTTHRLVPFSLPSL